jgi:hypothetical protein
MRSSATSSNPSSSPQQTTMQTPSPQFTQPDIILPELTLEELRTHHQRRNFYLLAKYGTEESWPHDQAMHMQRLEQAIAQREGHAATPNTAVTVEEDGPETAQASKLPTKDDSKPPCTNPPKKPRNSRNKSTTTTHPLKN